jgi:hypothetical protein
MRFVRLPNSAAMKDSSTEDEIKTRLRELTERTRALRLEVDRMLRGRGQRRPSAETPTGRSHP